MLMLGVGRFAPKYWTHVDMLAHEIPRNMVNLLVYHRFRCRPQAAIERSRYTLLDLSQNAILICIHL